MSSRECPMAPVPVLFQAEQWQMSLATIKSFCVPWKCMNYSILMTRLRGNIITGALWRHFKLCYMDKNWSQALGTRQMKYTEFCIFQRPLLMICHCAIVIIWRSENVNSFSRVTAVECYSHQKPEFNSPCAGGRWCLQWNYGGNIITLFGKCNLTPFLIPRLCINGLSYTLTRILCKSWLGFQESTSTQIWYYLVHVKYDSLFKKCESN